MYDALSFVQRELAKTGGAPSKRAVKNRSGRTSRKQKRGQVWLASVGGTENLVRAIYLEGNLCRVVSNDVGWKANGEPNRL